jgi:hypothetical protein
MKNVCFADARISQEVIIGMVFAIDVCIFDFRVWNNAMIKNLKAVGGEEPCFAII